MLSRNVLRPSGRIVRLLERRRLLVADAECAGLEFEADTTLEHLPAASIHARRLRRLIPALRAFHHSGFRLRYRIAAGPNGGHKALNRYLSDSRAAVQKDGLYFQAVCTS